jgi:hypothetical protein
MKDNYSAYSGLFGWLILPNLITTSLQSFLYRILYSPASRPRPQTARSKKDYARIYTLVILTYLSYSAFQSYQHLPLNHFDTLDLPVSATPQEIKSRFRKLSMVYHPDKNPSEHAQKKFYHIRKAYEVLSEPTKQSLYDRFGPEGLDCTHCKTERDYFYNAIMSFPAYYGGVCLFLVVLWVLGKGLFAAYFRFVVLFGLSTLELHIMTRTASESSLFSMFYSFFFPSLLGFQKIQLLRQLFTIVFVALSQVGPIVIPSRSQPLKPLLRRLEMVLNFIVQDASNDMTQCVKPFKTDVQKDTFQRKLEKTLVETAFRNNEEYNEMYSQVHDRVVRKRK